MEYELSELDKQSDAINNRRRELRQQIANAQAKFKVGDRVTFNGAKYVWQITSIVAGHNNEPKYIGAKLKKDRTPGTLTGEIWSFGEMLRNA